MKYQLPSAIAFACFLSVPMALAEKGHDHDHGHDHGHKHANGEKHGGNKAGPNGGRVIHLGQANFELFVTPEKKLKITFLDDEDQVAKPGNQVISAIGGDRLNPIRFKFTNKEGVLISDKALPEGKMIQLVLEVKEDPEAKTQRQKLMLNLAKCSECEHLEYACTCDH